MSFFNDTYCQLCERFITEVQWNKHLYSRRHLARNTHGFWPAYFPQSKLTKDENMRLEKFFWKMFFATRDIKEVEDFWLTYTILTIIMKDYFLRGNEEEVKKVFRSTMQGQLEHDLYKKSLSVQLESEETDTLQQGIK